VSGERPVLGLRTRLCHLSIAAVAALATVLAGLIDRQVGATIRSASAARLGQAQHVVAESTVALLDRGGDAELEGLLREVVATAPFELAACFAPDGRLRAAAARRAFTDGQQSALRRYGASNSLELVAREFAGSGLRFLQHPLLVSGRWPASRGTLLLATCPPAEERRIAAMSRYLWSAAGLGAGAAMLAVVILARALTRPLLAFVADVGRLERGQPVPRRATSRRDEIGLLSRAFDRMTQDVSGCRQELKARGERLAQAVAQRKETLGAALRDLKELGRRKDAFLSSISHELRTPLAVIQNSAEILAGSEDPAARAEFASGMLAHARELDRLVGNLLLLVELQRCERVAVPHARTLGAILEEALAEIDAERALRGVEIARDLDPGLEVRWDPFLAARLLRELLLNAVRFSPRGATVRVAAASEGARLRVTVEDSGPGIPAARCEEVFERFHQIGDVLTGKPKGAGLGLPICREIAVLHGGWIRAEPRAGGGARLVVELPADAASATRSEEPAPEVLQMLKP